MNIAAIFSGLDPKLATVLISMLPIAELRGAIPIALGVYKLDILSTYFLAVLGNIIPVIFLVWFLGPISAYLIKRFSWAKRFFDWLFARTRHKFSKSYAIWGEIALVIFVAIPLPMTGGWTGAVAAFLFGIPKFRSFILVSLGVAIAGVIVTLAITGTISIL